MTNGPSTLQDFPYAAAIQAVKDSLAFADYDQFYQHLLHTLPQNSSETRKRYASLVTRWFFPDHHLTSLLPRTWQAYHDENLMKQVARVQVLENEPVIARFVTDVVYPIAPGEPLPPNAGRDYIVATYGTFKENSHQRLLTTAFRLDFLTRRGVQWIVAAIPPPVDGLLILIHARLAPTPRIVRVADLLATPWWRCLGLRTPDDLRTALRTAHAAGLIARYSVVDDLEQITTRYALDDYLGQALRLPG
jgi:hypothetical protein